jgi:hypothetical protein
MADLQPLQLSVRRCYRRPRLVRWGDVRTVTLGGSPGAGDSGIGDPRRPLIIGPNKASPFPPD